MSTLALIPARGGSKRIPMKNVRPFDGVPIVSRVIENVIRAGIADRVIVSTDHDAIRQVALTAGASVPFLRSEDTSGDHATLHQVVRETLERLADPGIETIVCVLPTAVLVEPETLRSAARLFANEEHDSLISVQAYRHPIERALRIAPSGYLERSDEAAASLRTQDIRPAYHDAGQFYFARVKDLLSRTSLMGSRCLPLVLSELQARDIDTPDDWLIAEAIFRGR